MLFMTLFFIYHEQFTLENVKYLRNSINQHYLENVLLTTLIFFFLYMLITVFAIPIATIVVLIVGSIYGVFWGTALISFASTIGACISLLISRNFLRSIVEKHFSKKIKLIQKGFDKDGSYYLLSLRLTPFFPYVLINILFGFTNIRLRDFYFISQIGIIINTFFYIYAGAKLGEIESFKDILSFELWLSLCIVGCLPILLRLVWKKIKPAPAIN